MTSTTSPTAGRVRGSARAALLGLCVGSALFAACKTLPPESVQETIDERTGVTVMHLGVPVQVLRTAVPGVKSDPFGFVGPFETNRMGARALYLWLNVPADGPIDRAPTVSVDGEVMELHALSSLELAGIARSPYQRDVPWSAEFFYAADAAQIDRLAQAQRIELTVQYRESGEQHFASTVLPADLARFAERVAAH